MKYMKKHFTKITVSLLLVLIMILSSGCAAQTNKQSSTDVTKLDATVEAIEVALEERERYKNPISDENQPYRELSKEADLLAGIDEDRAGANGSRTGDPYILRYNGKFYLYVSTEGWTCTYRVWESLDLMHYTFLGEFSLLGLDGKRIEGDNSTNQGFKLECAWAPEVHYWNGEFYMYTSPHASGHVVLKSTTGLPYGDFQMVNEDLSSDIDGSFFIDDNEDKYFLRTYGLGELDGSWAASVKAKDMQTLVKRNDYELMSRTGITGEHVEGPFLFKRYGIYYLITTGEGVSQPGYRLNYAYNMTGLGNELNIGSVGGEDNWQLEMEPCVILNTEGEYISYGHGAVTVGPDLDSYWFPYHLTRASGGRTLGINRIEFAGGRMSVMGQDQETFVPSAPDFYTSYFEALSDKDWAGKTSGVIAREAGYRSYTEERTAAGEGLHQTKDGKFLSGRLSADGASIEAIKTGSRFTAEYSFKNVATDGSFKCLFGGGYVTINGKTVELYKGTEKIAEAPMLVSEGEDWNWGACHDIIVTYEEGRIAVTIDGCMKIDMEATGFGNDVIGFDGVTKSQIGSAVFSNQAFGSSDREIEKPLEGTFYATNYYEAKEGESATILSKDSKTFLVETEGDEDVYFNGTYYTYHIYKDAKALKLAEGDRAVYKIDVTESGLYSFESLYSTDSAGSVIKLQIDNETPTCYKLAKNDYSGNTYTPEYYEALKYQKNLIDEIYLEKGLHTLTVKAVKGDYTAIEYEMNRTSETAPEYSDALSEKAGHSYFSTWSIKEGAYYAPKGIESLVRFGGSDFTDYRVKVDVKTSAMVSREGKAGIILRMTQPSIYYRQTYGSSKGYFVYLDQYGVALERLDYSERLVAYSEDMVLDPEKYYTLEAQCEGNKITVWLDGEEVFTYVDPYGFACGAAALFSHSSEAYYKNLVITPPQ